MAKVTTMEDLFLDEIRDLYDAEKQLTKALPKMAKAASSQELKKALEDHLRETQNQVERLEQVFDMLEQKATGKKCAAMAGLVKEGQEMVASTSDAAVRDAGIIAAAQKVEHYEISGYGSARTFAQLLRHEDVATLLEETLNEEKMADRKLNDIAESQVNEEATDESMSESATSSSRNGSKSARASGGKTRTAGGH